MLQFIIWIALTLGAAAAVAALWGHYRVLPSWLTGPEVCKLEDGGCAVLFRSPRARLLGVPNAALGLLLYALLAAGLLLGWPPLLLFVMTLPAVAMSAFLGYSLISRGLECRICWTGHISNAVLAGSLLLTLIGSSDHRLIGSSAHRLIDGGPTITDGPMPRWTPDPMDRWTPDPMDR
jgi:uncharacterized membrane protein